MLVTTMTKKIIRTYSELITLPTFMERFRYLKLGGQVGEDTFGFDRYINQKFYKSKEWLSLRDEIIIRDLGCDLGVEGYDIKSRILIHHMNPITKFEIINQTDFLLNPEYLICTTKNTHDAIHYGNEDTLISLPTVRTKNDTCPWRR